MTVFSNKFLFITIAWNIFVYCYADDCILPAPLCDIGKKQTIQNMLDSGPNLKKIISALEETNFLNQYKHSENNEDKDLNLTQLVAKYGFKLESHRVKTEDGYIICLNRIPGDGDPVFLAHGLLNSAADWFTVGRENALPYLLAEQGYDVWLLNARGTIDDSRGHVSLSPDNNPAQYWDFSWDEIGRFDLPASIDFVLKITGKPTLKYVGFSQGTTSFYVMASEKPAYCDKISLMISLSPIAYMTHMLSPLIRLLAIPADEFSEILRNVIGFHVLKQTNPLVQYLTKFLCGNTEVATLLCGNIVFLMSGFDYNQMNVTQMPVIMGHTPSASTSKQLVHYAQGIYSEKFKKYDYGLLNMAKYGALEPPEYPVEKISTPVALFYRKSGDWFSAYKDVLTLKNKLPNVVDFYEVPHEHWCHTDYIWGKDVKKLVYNRVLRLLKKY